MHRISLLLILILFTSCSMNRMKPILGYLNKPNFLKSIIPNNTKTNKIIYNTPKQTIIKKYLQVPRNKQIFLERNKK